MRAEVQVFHAPWKRASRVIIQYPRNTSGKWIVLGNRDLYLLSMAICTHDLGMVLPLKSYTDDEVLKSNHSVTDPVHFENYVRDIHHLVIGRYF